MSLYKVWVNFTRRPQSCVTQYFTALQAQSDQTAPRLIVQYHISIQHPLDSSDELKWQVKMPPPQPAA